METASQDPLHQWYLLPLYVVVSYVHVVSLGLHSGFAHIVYMQARTVVVPFMCIFSELGTFVHTCNIGFVRWYMIAWLCVCVCVCLCTRECVCVRMCVYHCVYACMRTLDCMCAGIHTHA